MISLFVGKEYTVEEMKLKKLKIQNEKIIDSNSEPVYDLIRKVEMNRESDKVRDRERIKENRMKKKLKLKQKSKEDGEGTESNHAFIGQKEQNESYEDSNEDDNDGEFDENQSNDMDEEEDNQENSSVDN